MAVLNANIRIFNMGVITEVTPCISGLISRGRLKLSRRDKTDSGRLEEGRDGSLRHRAGP